MLCSGKTKVCALIGDPVGHSLSPTIHNAAFQDLGLNFIYVAFAVSKDELKDAVMGARSLGFHGLNVTMPYKKAVMKYLDEIDLTVRSIGAVNTILNCHGKLVGYNTDGTGAMSALQENGIYIEETKMVLLGAGGAAKAIAYEAAKDVKELVVLNRTLTKAQQLAIAVRLKLGANVKGGSLSPALLNEELSDTDILVNATSVGMEPKSDNSPVPSDLLRSDMAVMDTIYNPLETKLLKDAKSVGAKIVSGIEMLVYQGAAAFQIWTNCPAPVRVMKNAVLLKLQEDGKCK